jgi:hypothetical protein
MLGLLHRARECFEQAQSTVQASKYAHRLGDLDAFAAEVEKATEAAKCRDAFEQLLKDAGAQLSQAGMCLDVHV